MPPRHPRRRAATSASARSEISRSKHRQARLTYSESVGVRTLCARHRSADDAVILLRKAWNIPERLPVFKGPEKHFLKCGNHLRTLRNGPHFETKHDSPSEKFPIVLVVDRDAFLVAHICSNERSR